MTIGYWSDRNTLDQRLGEAAYAFNNAINRIETISSWLALYPINGSDDPLVSQFNYTADEAGYIRAFVEGVHALQTSDPQLFSLSMRMSGIQ